MKIENEKIILSHNEAVKVLGFLYKYIITLNVTLYKQTKTDQQAYKTLLCNIYKPKD